MENRTARKRELIKMIDSLNEHFFDRIYTETELYLENQLQEERQKRLNPEQANIVNFKN